MGTDSFSHSRLGSHGPDMIRLPAIQFSYPESGFHLDVSGLDIVEEGVIALIGSNGSGKSTYGKQLAHSSSENWFYMPQHPEDFLFAENLAEQVRELLHLDMNRAHMDEILLNLGFEDPGKILELPLHFFSGGEQRRLALATALYARPPRLILDEPSIGLTQKEKLVIRQNLDKLISDRISVMVITHDLDLLRSSRSVIALSNGKMGYHGTTDEFLGWSTERINEYGIRFHGIS